jgi:hypothetical protein
VHGRITANIAGTGRVDYVSTQVHRRGLGRTINHSSTGKGFDTTIQVQVWADYGSTGTGKGRIGQLQAGKLADCPDPP